MNIFEGQWDRQCRETLGIYRTNMIDNINFPGRRKNRIQRADGRT